MKVSITDFHNSHGLVFKLHLVKDGKEDDYIIDFLDRKLRPLIEGRCKNQSTLYVHQIILDSNKCSIQLVEQVKKMAVAHNALAIETCADEVPSPHCCRTRQL